MPKPILNRSFQLPADSWYEIEVEGEHVNLESNVVQVIDSAAIESICNRFEQASAAPEFAGVLIDYDHFSLDTDKSSKAAGWVEALRNRKREDGKLALEAKIRWSRSGEEDVKGGDFRFFSTVYPAPNECEQLGERKIANRKTPLRIVRPLQLDRLALTNDPNNKGGKPISNRTPGASPGAGENKPTDNMNPLVIQLLAALGVTLAPDAAPEAVNTALNQALTKVTETKAIENRHATLKADYDALLAERIESDLKTHEGVITNRESVKAMLISNRSGTLAMLAGLKLATPAVEAAKPITNRAGARTPTAAEVADVSAKQAQAVEAIRIKNRCSHKEAWAQAARENPELFGTIA